MCRRAIAAIALVLAVCAFAPAPAFAFGLNPFKAICTLGGDTVLPKDETFLCKAAASPGKVLSVGKKLLSGHLGSALHEITGAASTAAPALGLAAIVTWVLGGAGFALHETATLLGKTTSPELGEAWFSSTYLHMAAIATLLTLPFLFAAAMQAMMRSDVSLLARASLGYLPLAMIAIAIAAPLTMLLLAASDSLSNIIEQAAGGGGTTFLTRVSLRLGTLAVIARSPFVAFLIGFFVAAGGLVLWLELLLREVAVYVIVLMLPLVFAAFVWPARRWAIRAVELLVALILAKLAIVAVLALGAGALEHAAAGASIVSLMAGVALVTLGAFAPWALVKLMPLGELAAAAAGPLRGQLGAAKHSGEAIASPWAHASSEWAGNLSAGMRRQAMAADPRHAQGAEAEAGRLADLNREPGGTSSREPDSSPDALSGVAGGGDQDPFRVTAHPPGGLIAGATAAPPAPGTPPTATPVTPLMPDTTGTPATPGMPTPPGTPSGPGAPPDPAEEGPEHHQTSSAERGPSPRFEGFDGPEPMWQAREGEWNALELGPEMCAPDAFWPPRDDNPRPPAQEPEDGHQ